MQQGADFAHRIKELVLSMLYAALQGALDRNIDVVTQLRLDYKAGEFARFKACFDVDVQGCATAVTCRR